MIILDTALAHGGLAGAIVEALVGVAVVGVLVAVWVRERSARDADGPTADGE